MIKYLAAGCAAIALVLVAIDAGSDEVTLADGRKLVGRVTEDTAESVTVLTYKDGPISARPRDVKARKVAKSLYDDYDAKKTEHEDTVDGHLKLAAWCKEKGLTWQARSEWRRVTELDPDHDAARKALGDKKVKGAWVTFEAQNEAKGLALFEGKWLPTDQIDKIKRARIPAYGWVLTATYKGDADVAFLESWGERTKEASRFMWELSEGQLYVEEITITDHGGPADFTIVNKDLTKAKPGEYYAITLEDTIEAPGKILAYTFFHELIHLKYNRREHCDNCRHCIMSSDPTASKLCDDGDHKSPLPTSCWGAIRAFHKKHLALLPLTRSGAKLGKVPDTKVIVKDR